MSTGLAHRTYDNGGLCYAACQEAFEWYVLLTVKKISTGGTLQFSGAKRAAISQEVDKAIHF